MISSKLSMKIYQDAIENNDLPVSLDASYSLGYGVVQSCDNNVNYSLVGVDKLQSQSDVSDYDFMAGLVSIYHESRHVKQVHEIHNNVDEYLNPLKYSYYAGQCCCDYMETENVGWKQDRMLASIYLNQKQNTYLKDYIRGLSCVDWSLDNAFSLSGLSDRIKNTLNIRPNRGQEAEVLFGRVMDYEYHNNDTEYE